MFFYYSINYSQFDTLSSVKISTPPKNAQKYWLKNLQSFSRFFDSQATCRPQKEITKTETTEIRRLKSRNQILRGNSVRWIRSHTIDLECCAPWLSSKFFKDYGPHIARMRWKQHNTKLYVSNLKWRRIIFVFLLMMDLFW